MNDFDKVITAIVSLLLAMVALGYVVVLVAGGSQTPNVISAIGQQFARALNTVLCPITNPGNCQTLPTGTSSSTFTPGPVVGSPGSGRMPCANFNPVTGGSGC